MTDQRTSSISNSKLLVRRIFLPLALIFAAVALPVDALVSWLVSEKAELSNSYKIAKLSEREGYMDEVPLFGPSIARNAYFMDSVGPNYYNYSMENASWDIIQLMLQLETDKAGKKAPIMIDFHFRVMELDTSDNMRSINIRTYLPFVIKDKRIRNFLAENDRLRPHQRIPGMRYFGVYTTYAKDYIAEVYQPVKLYSRGGVFNKKSPPAEQFDRLIEVRREHGMKRFVRNPEVEASMEELIASNPDRTFVFVGSPRHYTVLEMLENYDDMKAWGREMQNKYPNVRTLIFEQDGQIEPGTMSSTDSVGAACRIIKLNFLYPEDPNDADDKPNRLYKDTGHLSLEGAKTFSGLLRRILAEEGLLYRP